MLGISLWYVFTQLKQVPRALCCKIFQALPKPKPFQPYLPCLTQEVYKTKAEEAEWREDGGFPVTRSGYFVKVRNCRIQVDDEEAAWNDLPTCDAPENPNFHQVAGLLTYGFLGGSNVGVLQFLAVIQQVEGCLPLRSCPPGHRPYLDAQSPLRSDKHPVLAAGCGSAALGCRLQCRSCLHRYPVWESCVPCQPGRYKSSPGNHDCSYCGADRIPAATLH